MPRGKRSNKKQTELFRLGDLSKLDPKALQKYKLRAPKIVMELAQHIIAINVFYHKAIQKYLKKQCEQQQNEEEEATLSSKNLAVKVKSKSTGESYVIDKKYIKKLTNLVKSYATYLGKLSIYKYGRVDRIERLNGANKLVTVGNVLSGLFREFLSSRVEKVDDKYLDEVGAVGGLSNKNKLLWPEVSVLEKVIAFFEKRVQQKGSNYSNKDLDQKIIGQYKELKNYIERRKLEGKAIEIDYDRPFPFRLVRSLYGLSLKGFKKTEFGGYNIAADAKLKEIFGKRPSGKKPVGKNSLDPNSYKTMNRLVKEFPVKSGKTKGDLYAVDNAVNVINSDINASEANLNLAPYVVSDEGGRNKILTRKISRSGDEDIIDFFNKYFFSLLLKLYGIMTKMSVARNAKLV